MAKSPAWQRAEGKNPKGGLNAKGRASYNAANPGKPGLMTIVAHATGRFPLVPHGFGAQIERRGGSNAHSETKLLYFEVYPR